MKIEHKTDFCDRSLHKNKHKIELCHEFCHYKIKFCVDKIDVCDKNELCGTKLTFVLNFHFCLTKLNFVFTKINTNLNFVTKSQFCMQISSQNPN